MSHDNHNDHHHVDDLSGFSLFRLIWPAALLVLVVFVTRNACCSGSCHKPGAKTEVHDNTHAAPAHHEEAAPAHH